MVHMHSCLGACTIHDAGADAVDTVLLFAIWLSHEHRSSKATKDLRRVQRHLSFEQAACSTPSGNLDGRM